MRGRGQGSGDGPAIIGVLRMLRPRSERRGHQPRRVLLQTDRFERGGVERHILDLAAGLTRRGYAVHLLVCGDAAAEALGAARSIVPVHRLGRWLRSLRYAWLIRRTGAAVVSAHHSTFGAAIARRLGCGFVQTVHSAYVWLSPSERDGYSAAEPFTRAYVVFSEFVREYASNAQGLDGGRMLLCPPGVDLARLCPAPDAGQRGRARRELGLDENERMFLSLASVCRPKAQLEIVEAARRLRAKGARFRVVLAGAVLDASYLDAVQARISLGRLRDTVTLLGFREEVRDLYLAADAYLMPSYFEGAGLSLIEALSCGLPVIATAVGSAPELVGGNPRHRLLAAPYPSILEIHSGNLAAMFDRGEAVLSASLAQAMEELLALPPAPREPRLDLGLDPMLAAYEELLSDSAANPGP